MLHSWSHPALTHQIISYVTDIPLPRMCTQLSNAITKDHFIHHSDSKAVHSVIQCHHIGPFHTPLESDSRSYVPDSMTKIILQRVCHYGIFILYFLINWGLNRTPPIGITLFAKLWNSTGLNEKSLPSKSLSLTVYDISFPGFFFNTSYGVLGEVFR